MKNGLEYKSNPKQMASVQSPVTHPIPPSRAELTLVSPLQPEELTLLLIKLRRQQAELNSLREHTLAQLMQLNLDASNPKVSRITRAYPCIPESRASQYALPR